MEKQRQNEKQTGRQTDSWMNGFIHMQRDKKKRQSIRKKKARCRK